MSLIICDQLSIDFWFCKLTVSIQELCLCLLYYTDCLLYNKEVIFFICRTLQGGELCIFENSGSLGKVNYKQGVLNEITTFR